MSTWVSLGAHAVSIDLRMCACTTSPILTPPTLQFETLKEEQIMRTFRTNIFGYMFMAQAALPHLKEGASSVTLYV